MEKGCNLLICEATCTLFGCVIGAGILGIPYIVAKAGLMTGLVMILVLGLVIFFLNLFVGEIVLRTKGSHQLTGYAEKYLGKKGKFLMMISMMIGIYGALLAYLIGEGEVLSAFIPLSPITLSLGFFGITGVLIYFGLKTVKYSETLFSVFFLMLIVIILAASIGYVKVENLTSFNFGNIFLPYGVILFAFIGTVAIPEMKRILIDNKKQLKKCIFLGSLIPLSAYLLFTLVVVGATGLDTSEIATVALGGLIGPEMVFFGNVFAVLAMATSFLILGLALRNMFMFDYKLSRGISILLTLGVPLGAYLVLNYFNILSFISVIGITGVFAGGIDGILIVLMLINAKKFGDRRPEYSLKSYKLVGLGLVLIFVVGMVDQVIRLL